MKIVLLNPKLTTWSPNVYLPLGLAYVAAALEKAKHEVKVLDMNCQKISDSRLTEAVKDADVIGLTGMITEFKEVLRVVGLCREANKCAKIMLGGGLTTTNTEDVLRQSSTDVAVIGEGEKTAVDLLSAFQNGLDYKQIKGIAYRNNGDVIFNPPVEQIKDLDTIPFPARHLFDLSKYTTHHFKSFGIKHLRVKSTTMLSSRGCPYQCTYCFHSIWGYKWRGRSAQNIFDEIKELNSKYGFNAFVFNDDTFVMNSQRVKEFCKLLIDSKLGVKWYANGRVNLMTEEMLNDMAKAGCVGIGYGLESGNQGMLKSIKKGVTLQQVEDAVRLTHKAGINITGYFILGLLHETKANIEETIKFARKLDLDFYAFAMYAPIIGTPLYKTAQDLGLINQIKIEDWSLHASANLTQDCTYEELERYSEYAFRELIIKKRYGKYYLLNPVMWYDGLKSMLFVMRKRSMNKFFTKVWWIIRKK